METCDNDVQEEDVLYSDEEDISDDDGDYIIVQMNTVNHCIHTSEPYGQSGTVFITKNHSKIFVRKAMVHFGTSKTSVKSDSNMAKKKKVYVIHCNVLATSYHCYEE